jgi:uncharacterized protein HemX
VEIDTLFTEPYAAGPAHADHRPRQAAYVVTIMVLALAAAGLSVGLLQTRQSQEVWQATAERRSAELEALEAHRDDLRRQLLDAQLALTSAEESHAATTARLDEATGQVRTLTEEKARMLDKATFMPAALSMATELAQSVSACALVLEGSSSTEPAVVAPPAEPAALVAPAVEGDQPCDRARTDSEAFTKWLGSQ